MSTVCHRWDSLCRNCMERRGEQWRVRTWHWQILECVNKVHFIEGKTIFDGQNVCLYLQKGMQKQEWASWRQKPLFFTLNQIEWLSQKQSREDFTKKRERENYTKSHICVKLPKFVIVEDKAGSMLPRKQKQKSSYSRALSCFIPLAGNSSYYRSTNPWFIIISRNGHTCMQRSHKHKGKNKQQHLLTKPLTKLKKNVSKEETKF